MNACVRSRVRAQLVHERGQQQEIRALRDDVCTLRAERGQLERLCRDVQEHYSALRVGRALARRLRRPLQKLPQL